jgi:DNA (cytosine-5)-methyltransferase 1
MNRDDYFKKTKSELIAICKEQNLIGYSGKNKETIIKMITSKNKDIHYEEMNYDYEEMNYEDYIKNSNFPIAISLFSGAGGDSLGIKNSGYIVIAFSEKDKSAIQTHNKAFPNSVHIINKKTNDSDIKNLPPEALVIYKNKLDIVFAGFPCQGFSNAGKKNSEDPRNELVYEFARVVNITKPKWIIGENVPGLLSRTGKDPVTLNERPVIDIIRDIFDRIGYNIIYKILVASDYGVPQERKRLIIIGSPRENGIPEFPEIENSKVVPNLKTILESHLDCAMIFPKENIPDNLSSHYWIKTEETLPSGNPHPNLVRLVNGVKNLPKNAQTGKNEQNGKKIETIVEGGLISFGVRKSAYHGQILDPLLPSKTIISTYSVCPRLFVGLYNVNTDTYWVRCLSVCELGQIQGFPKDYPWMGNKNQIITQIGNAVPPPLVSSVIDTLPKIKFS